MDFTAERLRRAACNLTPMELRGSNANMPELAPNRLLQLEAAVCVNAALRIQAEHLIAAYGPR